MILRFYKKYWWVWLKQDITKLYYKLRHNFKYIPLLPVLGKGDGYRR